MVGVAGRSRACATCRGKRRRCDLRQPHCSQCAKSGKKCPGYTNGPIFIHAKNSSATRCSQITSKLSHISEPRATRDHHGPFLWDMWPACSGPSAYECLLNVFLTSYLPPVSYPNASEAPWLLLCSGSKVPVLKISLTALSASTLGHENSSHNLIIQGAQKYSHGLQALQRALQHPHHWRSDETLAACMALLLYEAVECPASSRAGYLNHLRGMAQLVQTRGPTSYKQPLGHKVFCSFRLIEALHALESHFCSFLVEPPWLTKPWHNMKKNAYDEIVDTLLQIPGLLKEADEILDAPKGEHGRMNKSLIDHYWKLDDDLARIERNVTRTTRSSDQLYWPVLSKFESPADDSVLGKVFPVTYRFVDLNTALGMMLLWSTKAMVWAGLRGSYEYMSIVVQGHQSFATECTRQLRTLGDRAEWITMARNAFQCVEYCLEEPASGHAKMSVTVSLQMVAGYLQTCPAYYRELGWAASVLESLSGGSLRIVKCTLDRFKPNWQRRSSLSAN